MALPLGKLSILVGAGLLGSVLAKEGRLSGVSDLVSGALKVAFKQIKQDDATSSVSKPRNDILMAQVNSLRQELQMLASNRSVTIVTATGSGASRYGAVVVVVAVGYGYVWWKGWKLPDMMFATKRSLSDACTSIAKQLENVYESIRTTRRQLSSSIDQVDTNLNEVAALTGNTQEKVTELLEDSARIGNDVQYVRNAVEKLELKISTIEGNQDITVHGVQKLVDFTDNLQNNLIEGNAQASRITFPSKKGYLPAPSSEPTSPSVSSRSLQVQRALPSAALTSAQQSNGISGAVEVSSTPGNSDGYRATDETNNSSSGWFSSVLQRTRSARSAVLQQTSSNRQQY